MYEFGLNNITFRPNNHIVIIAGPCVIESEEHCLFMANKLKELSIMFDVPLIFKSSFLKANRSSIDSYTGPASYVERNGQNNQVSLRASIDQVPLCFVKRTFLDGGLSVDAAL